MVARRAAQEVSQLQPQPPALRIFDAGMGDATVLSRLMGSAHRDFPTVPLLAVAKEISLEDVRLGLEKMPDRFHEHPHTVLVITNLSYMEAPQLTPKEGQPPLVWHTLRLAGTSSYAYVEQIEALGPVLTQGWQTRPNAKTGNPTVVQPTALVIYREDHEFMLERRHSHGGDAPHRVRLHSRFATVARPDVGQVQGGEGAGAAGAQPQSRRAIADAAVLRPGPGLEIVQRLWPDENPFMVGRRDLLQALETALGPDAKGFTLDVPPDEEALFQYRMHTLPSEIGDRIGTSTLFAAWNAVIYVNQIEDERLDPVVTTGSYLEATQDVLHKHGGLWFNDEAFVVTRRAEDG